MTAVEKAEATIKSLQDKQKDLTARAAELAEERRHIALAAHSGADSKARARLDKINAEHATFSSEMNSLAEAILEATDRLKAAQQDEACAQDREKGLQL